VFQNWPILLEEPWRISNADESGKIMSQAQLTSIVQKGQANAHINTSGMREHVTLLANMRADGSCYPPCVIFQAEKLPANILQGSVEGAGVWGQKSGWMEGDAFHKCVTDFWYPLALVRGDIDAINVLLLLVDGHRTHVLKKTIEWAWSTTFSSLCLTFTALTSASPSTSASSGCCGITFD
jgi:hypothetical protein